LSVHLAPFFGVRDHDEDVALHGRAAAEVGLAEVEGPGAGRGDVGVGGEGKGCECRREKDGGHTKGGFEHGLSPERAMEY
jgi:hypothetical protein